MTPNLSPIRPSVLAIFARTLKGASHTCRRGLNHEVHTYYVNEEHVDVNEEHVDGLIQ